MLGIKSAHTFKEFDTFDDIIAQLKLTVCMEIHLEMEFGRSFLRFFCWWIPCFAACLAQPSTLFTACICDTLLLSTQYKLSRVDSFSSSPGLWNRIV